MPTSQIRGVLAALTLLAASCGDPEVPPAPPPPKPELTAAAKQRLEQFADPGSWEDLAADAPGTRLRDPRTGVVFRRVPRGEFTMGDNKGDVSIRPQHRVVLSRDYLLAETELTIGQWRRCAVEFALDPAIPVPEGDGELPMPMNHLDAEQFATCFGYRLPTEAEWERACRGGLPQSEEPWRNEAGMRAYAWFHRNSELRAHPVATREPNPYGLCDMLGNLWEWCADEFDRGAYATRGKVATDPFVAPKITYRVLRGGSWFSVPPANPRTRMGAEINERNAFFGARFARSVEGN